MIFHPNHTFCPADAEVLSEYGFCIGYDIDGKPDPAMAAHPKHGFIVRTFWNGCSVWHPALSRMTEKVGSDMATVLAHTNDLKRSNHYRDFMKRPASWTRLAVLRSLAAAGKSENTSRENV